MKTKRLHPSAKNHFLPLTILGAITICVIFLSGCDLFAYKRPFADSYYENNFIASIGFDQFVGNSGLSTLPAPDSLTGVISPISGKWDFSYRYQNWDGFDYMTLTPTNLAGDPGLSAADFGTAPAGLDGASPVYRLEMVNLISGGDLETYDTDPTVADDWTYLIDTASPSFFNLSDSATGINGKSLKMNLTKTGDNVSYTIPVQLVENDNYYINFKWISTSDPTSASITYLNSNNTTIAFDENTKTGSADFTAKATNILSFGTERGLELSIDDLTVKKTIPSQLRLLLTQQNTDPPLGSFLYKFTFWVCPDPLVAAPTVPYHLNTLKADMQKTEYTDYLSSVPDVYNHDPVLTTGWQKMEVIVDNGNLTFTDTTGTFSVLELVIDLNDALPGRILISQPELRAYPDGY